MNDAEAGEAKHFATWLNFKKKVRQFRLQNAQIVRCISFIRKKSISISLIQLSLLKVNQIIFDSFKILNLSQKLLGVSTFLHLYYQ